jgi:copper homeostasis protein
MDSNCDRATITVEVAAHTIASAQAAQAGGAKRVELFSNWKEGGTTPSEGMIGTVREQISIPLHIMIRPRGGDFSYSRDEVLAMKRDIATAKRLGANGVVFGFVTLDGVIDIELTRMFVDYARPLSVTFHRGFDICRDLSAALEDLISCGVDRILTSGSEPCALEGIGTLAHLNTLAGNRIGIMAGGRVTPENVREIIQKTGIREIHAGLRTTMASKRRLHNEKLSFGEDVVVREKDVRKLVSAVESLS